VHHLLTLHEDLAAELEARGRASWHAEDCAALEDPALYRTEPDEAWRRLKGLGRLKPGEQAIARAIAAWRERRAIASDKPRGWILSDDVLYSLAALAPAATDDLGQVRGLPPAVIRKRGDELLATIASARSPAAHPPPVTRPPRPTPEQNRLIGELQKRVREVAEELGINAEVIATRRDVEALVFGPRESSSVTRGWRREVVGQQLLDATGAS
jgi:ribonuclease D